MRRRRGGEHRSFVGYLHFHTVCTRECGFFVLEICGERHATHRAEQVLASRRVESESEKRNSRSGSKGTSKARPNSSHMKARSDASAPMRLPRFEFNCQDQSVSRGGGTHSLLTQSING